MFIHIPASRFEVHGLEFFHFERRRELERELQLLKEFAEKEKDTVLRRRTWIPEV